MIFEALKHNFGHQAPLSMGFSTQEYWSGLPFPSPRDINLDAVDQQGVWGWMGQII